jgi:hypothetical protein
VGGDAADMLQLPQRRRHDLLATGMHVVTPTPSLFFASRLHSAAERGIARLRRDAHVVPGFFFFLSALTVSGRERATLLGGVEMR